MQPILEQKLKANQQRPQEHPLTSASREAVLAVQMQEFDDLSAYQSVFNNLRAYALSNPIELAEQKAKVDGGATQILNRRSDLPSYAPSIKKLIFDANFAHFEQQREEARDSRQVAFAA